MPTLTNAVLNAALSSALQVLQACSSPRFQAIHDGHHRKLQRQQGAPACDLARAIGAQLSLTPVAVVVPASVLREMPTPSTVFYAITECCGQFNVGGGVERSAASLPASG
jgi:hypothetical protein